MKKILSILLSGMIAASLLIGCSSATTEDNSAANEHQITETVEYTSLRKMKHMPLMKNLSKTTEHIH